MSGWTNTTGTGLFEIHAARRLEQRGRKQRSGDLAGKGAVGGEERRERFEEAPGSGDGPVLIVVDAINSPAPQFLWTPYSGSLS